MKGAFLSNSGNFLHYQFQQKVSELEIIQMQKIKKNAGCKIQLFFLSVVRVTVETNTVRSSQMGNN